MQFDYVLCLTLTLTGCPPVQDIHTEFGVSEAGGKLGCRMLVGLGSGSLATEREAAAYPMPGCGERTPGS